LTKYLINDIVYYPRPGTNGTRVEEIMTESTITSLRNMRKRSRRLLVVSRLIRTKLEQELQRKSAPQSVHISIKPVCAGLLPATAGPSLLT